MFKGILSSALFFSTILGFAFSYGLPSLDRKFSSSETFFPRHQNEFKDIIGIDFPRFSIGGHLGFDYGDEDDESVDEEFDRDFLQREQNRKLKLFERQHESAKKERESKQEFLEREREKKLKLLDYKHRDIEHEFREKGFLNRPFSARNILEQEDPYAILPPDLTQNNFKQKHLDILNQKLPQWENPGYIFDQEEKQRERDFLHDFEGSVGRSSGGATSRGGSSGGGNARGGSSRGGNARGGSSRGGSSRGGASRGGNSGGVSSRQGNSSSSRRGQNSNSRGSSNRQIEPRARSAALNINVEDLFPRRNTTTPTRRRQNNNPGYAHRILFGLDGQAMERQRRQADFHRQSDYSFVPDAVISIRKFSRGEHEKFPEEALDILRGKRVKKDANTSNGEENATEEYLILDGPKSSRPNRNPSKPSNSNGEKKLPPGQARKENSNKYGNGRREDAPGKAQRPGNSGNHGPPFGLGAANKEKFQPQNPGHSNSNNHGNSRPQGPGYSNLHNLASSVFGQPGSGPGSSSQQNFRPQKPGNSNSNNWGSSRPDSNFNSQPHRPDETGKEEIDPWKPQQNVDKPPPSSGENHSNIPEEFIRVGKRPENAPGNRRKRFLTHDKESLGIRDDETFRKEGGAIRRNARDTFDQQENTRREQEEAVTEKGFFLEELYSRIKNGQNQNWQRPNWEMASRPRPTNRPSSSWYWPDEKFPPYNPTSLNQSNQRRTTTTTTTTTTGRPTSSGFSNGNRPNDIKEHPNIKLLPTDTCGSDLNNRIIGGTNTQLEEFPWMALLQHTSEKGLSLGFGCGGSLISSRYVLTAAHCIKGPAIRNNIKVTKVRLGEYDTSQDVDCQGSHCSQPPTDVLVESIVPHPKYRATDRAQLNDIALIRLKENVKSTAYVNPICLPLYGSPKNVTGKKFIVAGWGKTSNGQRGKPSNIKQKVSVPGVSLEDCSPFYNRINIRLKDTQICAGGEKGKDSCQGDSGGPLMGSQIVGNQVRWQVRGIVSFGPEKCGIDNVAGVYTKVSEYLDWILDNMKP